MIAFTHASNTSLKNNLKASSVCGLVGLFGTVAVPLVAAPELAEARSNEDGRVVVVKGAKGGNTREFCEVDIWGGGVFGGCGRWRSMNLVEVGVRKQDMWDEAK